jgi:hypothetical protein
LTPPLPSRRSRSARRSLPSTLIEFNADFG